MKLGFRLTRLSPVASEKLALGLVPERPRNGGSHHAAKSPLLAL